MEHVVGVAGEDGLVVGGVVVLELAFGEGHFGPHCANVELVFVGVGHVFGLHQRTNTTHLLFPFTLISHSNTLKFILFLPHLSPLIPHVD